MHELSIKLAETKIRIVATRGWGGVKGQGEGSGPFVEFRFKRKDIMKIICRSICCIYTQNHWAVYLKWLRW